MSVENAVSFSYKKLLVFHKLMHWYMHTQIRLMFTKDFYSSVYLQLIRGFAMWHHIVTLTGIRIRY